MYNSSFFFWQSEYLGEIYAFFLELERRASQSDTSLDGTDDSDPTTDGDSTDYYGSTTDNDDDSETDTDDSDDGPGDGRDMAFMQYPKSVIVDALVKKPFIPKRSSALKPEEIYKPFNFGQGKAPKAARLREGARKLVLPSQLGQKVSFVEFALSRSNKQAKPEQEVAQMTKLSRAELFKEFSLRRQAARGILTAPPPKQAVFRPFKMYSDKRMSRRQRRRRPGFKLAVDEEELHKAIAEARSQMDGLVRLLL